MLKSTGIAGKPESYFRSQDEDKWALNWGLERLPSGDFKFTDYLSATIAAGRSGNGVFSARIMWGTMEEVARNLANVYPNLLGNDRDLLTRAFGHTRFVYLQRSDVIAQAVSLLRAVQTNVWHITDKSNFVDSDSEPHYDFNQISEYVEEINEHNMAWRHWFNQMGIEPYLLWYEELEKDPAAVVSQIINHLGLEMPKNRKITASNKRLADRLNHEWIERYRSDTDKHR